MDGNYEAIEYAINLWGWGMDQAGEGTIGIDVRIYCLSIISGYPI